MSSDLLDMKLQDISDYFLDELEKSENKCVKVDLPGHCKGERFVLRVCLCYDDEVKQ
jgi:hypothetical protein